MYFVHNTATVQLQAIATSRKVAGSIPDGIIGIFHWYNPSGRTMALGLIQPLTDMSIRNISWEVNAAGAYGWQPYHLPVPTVLKSGSVNLLEPSGPVQACNGIALPFTVVIYLNTVCNIPSRKGSLHIIYNKPTRCNSGSIVFIKNYKYALHVSDALCVHHQEHYEQFIVLLMMKAKGVRNM